MPFFDRTGPRGFGPMTGRGMGPCGGFFGFGRRGFGGRGYGRGFGRGGLGFYGNPQPLTSSGEKELLEDYREDLQAELNAVEKELQNLEE